MAARGGLLSKRLDLRALSPPLSPDRQAARTSSPLLKSRVQTRQWKATPQDLDEIARLQQNQVTEENLGRHLRAPEAREDLLRAIRGPAILELPHNATNSRSYLA